MYIAIDSIGAMVSPFIVNPLTTVFSKMGLNVFSVSGVLALIIGIICLASQFQKNLVHSSLEVTD